MNVECRANNEQRRIAGAAMPDDKDEREVTTVTVYRDIVTQLKLIADHHDVNILFVSSEVAPFAKTGGLGDVCGVYRASAVEVRNRAGDAP